MAKPKPLNEDEFEPVAPGAAPLDEAEYEVVTPEEPKKPDIGRIDAATATLTQGTTAGFGDEIEGVKAAVGGTFGMLGQGKIPTWADVKNAYTHFRDKERKRVADARQAYPGQSLATEIVGGLAAPIPGVGAAKTAATGAKLGVRAVQAAKSVGKAAAVGAAHGAAYGVGSQESGEGQIASLGENVTAAKRGGVAGAVGSVALKGASKAVGAVVNKVLPKTDKAGLKKVILDQVTRSPDGAKATPTAKKRLAKAGEAIFEELVTGPDGKTVQKAYQAATAQKGIEWLQPVINRVGNKNRAAYRAFEQAGKSVVDVPGRYATALKAAERKFRIGADGRTADPRMANGIAAVAKALTLEAKKVAEAGGVTDLRWLRSQTTVMQDAAARKIGGLNEHETAKFAQIVAHEAKKVLDDVIGQQAKGNPVLEKAARDIRRNNRRLFGLLGLKDALANRGVKEEVTGGPFEQFGKKVASVAKTGAVGAIAGGTLAGGAKLSDVVAGDEDALSTVGAGMAGGAALMLAGRGAQIGQRLDRFATGRAIEKLRAAAQGKGGPPNEVIKQVVKEFGMSERQARAAYIRLVLGGGSTVARPQDEEQP